MALSTLILWRCNLFPLDFFVHSKRRLLLSEQRYLCDKRLCLKVPVSAKSAVVEERIRASVTHAMHICWIRAEQREAIKWEEQESWKRCAPTSALTAPFVQIKTWFVHDGPSRLIPGPPTRFCSTCLFPLCVTERNENAQRLNYIQWERRSVLLFLCCVKCSCEHDQCHLTTPLNLCHI